MLFFNSHEFIINSYQKFFIRLSHLTICAKAGKSLTDYSLRLAID